MGSYADFKQLKNIQRMPGISQVNQTETVPSCNAKRKIVGDRNKTSQKTSESSLVDIKATKSTSSEPAKCPASSLKVDLREKIIKKRACPGGSSNKVVTTHKALKERMRSDSLLQFNKLAEGSKKSGEEDEDAKHRRQVRSIT